MKKRDSIYVCPACNHPRPTPTDKQIERDAKLKCKGCDYRSELSNYMMVVISQDKLDEWLKVVKNESEAIKNIIQGNPLPTVKKELMQTRLIEVTEIPLAGIHDNPFQPREYYDTEKIEALALDIAEKGLLQIPQARQQATDCYELAYGHRRKLAYEWLHQRWATEQNPEGDDRQWKSMPLIIVALTDEQMDDYAWSENEARSDISAIERAKALEKSINQFGYSAAEMARKRGVSEGYISNTRRLLQLPSNIQDMIKWGEITERHGRELVPLMTTLKQAELVTKKAVEIKKYGLSTKEVGRRVAEEIEVNCSPLTKKMREFNSWNGTLPEPCQATCAECPHAVRFKKKVMCSHKSGKKEKEQLYHDRLVELASKAVNLPIYISDGYISEIHRKEILTYALENSCEHLSVAHKHYVHYNYNLVDAATYPNVVYTCQQDSCTCLTFKTISDEEAAITAWTAKMEAEATDLLKPFEAEIKAEFSAIFSQISTRQAKLLKMLMQKMRITSDDEAIETSMVKGIKDSIYLERPGKVKEWISKTQYQLGESKARTVLEAMIQNAEELQQGITLNLNLNWELNNQLRSIEKKLQEWKNNEDIEERLAELKG